MDKYEYVLTRECSTFEVFLEKKVRPDPDRAQAYETVASQMANTFERVKETVDGRVVLRQRCAAYHFSLTRWPLA